MNLKKLNIKHILMHAHMHKNVDKLKKEIDDSGIPFDDFLDFNLAELGLAKSITNNIQDMLNELVIEADIEANYKEEDNLFDTLEDIMLTYKEYV